MVYTDSALEQLRNCFSKNSYSYEILSLDEKALSIEVQVGNCKTEVWFKQDKQIFGFNMIEGGSKPYTSFEDFEKYFTTYMYINSDFIPKAKLVADTFEQQLAINSVYDAFSGNKADGYTAQFRVLANQNKAIFITKVKSDYVAKLVEYTEDRSKVKVITEYLYEIEDGVVSQIPTIHSYMSKLTELYRDTPDDEIEINRIDYTKFVFVIEGMSISVDLEFVYKDIIYNVTQINNIEVTHSITLDDPYKLGDLYLKCMDILELASIDEDTDEPVEVEPLQEDCEPVEVVGVHLKKEKVSEPVENIDEVIEETPESDGVDLDTDEVAEPVEDEGEIKEMDGDIEQMEIKKIEHNEVVIGLQFNVDGKLYFCNEKAVREHNFPIERLGSIANLVMKHGIAMTEDEVAMRVFSEDITSNMEMRNKLFDSIFD